MMVIDDGIDGELYMYNIHIRVRVTGEALDSPSDIEIRHAINRAQSHLDDAHLKSLVLFQFQLMAQLLSLALDRGDVVWQWGGQCV